MLKINAIFPIAGKGARFGFQFKPKIKFNGKYFLEYAVDSILRDNRLQADLYFICTAQQEAENGVGEWLRQLYPDSKLIVISQDTGGPLETLASAKLVCSQTLRDSQSPCVICDCDHWLDLSPVRVDKLIEGKPTVLLPTWSISPAESKSWLIIERHENIFKLIEKPEILNTATAEGVIGCYFFSSTKIFFDLLNNLRGQSISDYLIATKESYEMFTYKIDKAIFFGDPQRLANARSY